MLTGQTTLTKAIAQDTSFSAKKAPKPPKTIGAMMEVLRLLRPRLNEAGKEFRPGYLREVFDGLSLRHRDGRMAMHVRPAVLKALYNCRYIAYVPGRGWLITVLGIDVVNRWDRLCKDSKSGAAVLQ